MKKLKVYSKLIDHIFNDIYEMKGEVKDTYDIMHEFINEANAKLIKRIVGDRSAMAQVINALKETNAINRSKDAVHKLEHTVGVSGEQPMFSGTVYKSVEINGEP